MIETDLAFLDPVTTVCDACEGARFGPEALRHRLGGRTIAQVLALTAEEAAGWLPAHAPRTGPALTRLVTFGLGHLTLDRPLTTLSGGERQRLKLAAEPRLTGRVVVLDEPTSGLHMADVARLLDVLDGLVDRGGTVVVVEHDLDAVARADHVVELGPGAGRDGGRVVFGGPPADLVGHPTSATARHLRLAVAA